MEFGEIKNKISEMENKIVNSRGLFDLDALEESIAENEAKMTVAGFWDNHEKAQKVIDETKTMKDKYDNFKELSQSLDDIKVSAELYQEDPEEDLMNQMVDDSSKLAQKLRSYELMMLLSEQYDAHNAIMEIHPGAGGTESQDWGSMLLRMYQRWAEQHNFSVEIEDYQPGDEAGIKSVSMMIRGKNAYGLLRSERGVHRLVRISPFDSAGRRHTSFASVDVMPELDDSIHVEINDDDLRVDVFRSSGAGGQHINKTSSAVRITHLPTGIVVSSQAQRSQLQNRETAMNMLKAKLFQRKEEEQAKKHAEIQGEQKDIGWGSQIRSYVFHPYTMVKDHRSNYETGNGQAVMDGDLDPFIYAYLQWKLQGANDEK
ncbi:peptide chain release factor 2 [Companilactobacillus alimentarius]|uniref:peptide chain release factor 2 n=1 Tax=Companilactobacillus alimentarius TaxID=1602 RepID=UPI0028B83933|nr:peptide chain release factor 2 [Companilactobacillus alimentarius]MDT6953430.1 peptide chain release factor 2 [Companilactobacillus alimentarius]